MQLNCPNCSEKVSAENINIQQMMAVCSACDSVFDVQRPMAKIKRRKVKQPTDIQVRETESQHELAFRTNFRLDKDENVIGAMVMSFAFTFITLLLFTEMLAGDGDVPFIIPIGFGLATLLAYYWVALQVYNKTHITLDEDSIEVARKPLSNPSQPPLEISLSGVVGIRCDETEKSKKEAYDTPRFRVWAERADGSRRTIVNDVTENYALFIAQYLDEHMTLDTESNQPVNLAHLVDVDDTHAEHTADDILLDIPSASQQSNS